MGAVAFSTLLTGYGSYKAKQSESGDLYDAIAHCGVTYEYLRLRPKVKAAGVHMPLHTR